MVRRRLRAFAFVFLSVAALAGCSDEDDEGEAGDDSTEVGTCNAVADGFCSEIEGGSPLVEDERQACLDFGDTWTTEPCPTGPELIGCCHYWEFRDCYYTGYIGPDPEQYCSEDWTVGGR